MNVGLLHNIKDGHKTIGDMDTDEIVVLDQNINEIGDNQQKQQDHDTNLNYIDYLFNDESSGSIETIPFNPKTNLNALDGFQNKIPEIHFKQAVKQTQKNTVKTKQLKNIWKTLLIKLNSLIKNEENLSLKSSKEDIKPIIIIMANSDKRDSIEIDTSDVKEIDSNERKKTFLRDGCVSCVQAQVKRCYKALKDSTKKTCGTYYCKSSFKKTFKKNSKKGCIAEFWKEENGKKGRKKNTTAILYVNHPDKPEETRTGLDLNVGCKDQQDNSYNHPIVDILRAMTSPNIANRALNILRNKYEKACKKAVAKKCNNVCIVVITETCSKHKCLKKQIKAFKKDCKKSCAIVFDVSKASDSSDSSDYSDEEDEDDEEDDEDED